MFDSIGAVDDEVFQHPVLGEGVQDRIDRRDHGVPRGPCVGERQGGGRFDPTDGCMWRRDHLLGTVVWAYRLFLVVVVAIVLTPALAISQTEPSPEAKIAALETRVADLEAMLTKCLPVSLDRISQASNIGVKFKLSHQ